MKNPENRLTVLDVAIMLTILGEHLAKTLYYERVNPTVHKPEDHIEQSERLVSLREKLAGLIPGDQLLDFIKYNPHLSELWPDVSIEDEIAKQLEDDQTAMATLSGEKP